MTMACGTVTLHLTPSSISENGGTANVTASLSGASSEAVTVVVTASPVSPAVSGDFAVSPNNTLTIAPGSTMSTDVVTITGVDNGVDALDKSVAVSATVSGGHGVSVPSSRTLTITDDDSAPTVTLDLSPPLHKRERRECQRHRLSQRRFFGGGDGRGIRVSGVAGGER